MTNKLKVNIKNKIVIINGAIEQCKRLINNETIELRGLHTIQITRGKLTDNDLLDRIERLKVERFDLSVKLSRFN